MSLVEQINRYIEDNRSELFYNDFQYLLRLIYKLEYHTIDYDEAKELFDRIKNQIEYRFTIKEKKARQKKVFGYPIDL